MLRLAIALWLPVALAASTTVAQSKITAGDGQHLATGKITITASAAFLAADGTWVETTPLSVPVINGAFSVQLEPNDTGIPSTTSYIAKWQLDGAAPRTDYWLVTTTGSTLSLAAVRINIPPSVSLMFSLGQLTAGVANGTYCVQVTNGAVTLTQSGCPGSVSGTGLSLSTLTNSQLSTLTNSQLASIGN
jgi:hypothetical protein